MTESCIIIQNSDMEVTQLSFGNQVEYCTLYCTLATTQMHTFSMEARRDRSISPDPPGFSQHPSCPG